VYLSLETPTEPTDVPTIHQDNKATREDRIGEYQSRVAAGQPLFEGGEPRTDAFRESACIGCGARAKYGRAGALAAGWETRTTILFGVPVVEVHCDKCLKEWGWGDMTEPKVRSNR